MAIGLSAGVVALFGVIAFVVYLSSLSSEGASLEASLTRQYSEDQNEYSNYGASIVESLGVADTKMDKVKELVVAYVSGRKSEKSGSLLTAVSEAVPDLGSAAIYDKIVDAIVAGREHFRAQQTKMLSQIQTYEVWLNSGLIQPKFIRLVGYPSNNLRATIGSESYTGQEALRKMREIITTAQSQRTFQTGTDSPLVQPQGKKK
jgi:hypothetical protein